MKATTMLPKISIALAAIACSMLASCTKLADNLQYNLDMQTAEVDVLIPSSSDTTANISGTESNSYNIDSFIRANTGAALGISNISSAKMKSCVLTLTNANSANNFQNFKSCFGSFYTSSNTSPYMVSIANNPDSYNTILSLPVDTTTELKSYLTATNFTYRLGGKLRRATTDTLHCKAKFVFHIVVKP